ncbi:signal peptidase I [Paenibacillus larvae]|uniref:signal peptidase I n=1 Tax=Paenibacillus larvae TaxID=1464 RepID=UPI0039171EA8
MEQKKEQSLPEVQRNTGPVKKEAWEWAKAILIAAVLVILIRWLLFAPFIVDGPSMEPNFFTNERLIVNKLIYKVRKPERGEVIVFHAPEGKDFIKRVIALPWETVKVEGDKVYINGEVLNEPYLKEAVDDAKKKGIPYNTINFQDAKVPEGTVFVMGDHRSNSKDSRSSEVGAVPYDKIVGRADVVFWPIKNFTLVNHGG